MIKTLTNNPFLPRIISSLLLYFFFITQVSSWCLRTTFAGVTAIESVDFSPDGQYIVTGEISGRVMLWKTDTLEILKVYQFGSRLWQAVYSKDQQYIAIAGEQDDLHIISPSNFTLLFVVSSGHGKIYDVDYRYDSARMITCGADKKTKMWNATDGTFFKQVTNQDEGYSCEYGDNKWFATVGHTFIQTFDNNTNNGNGSSSNINSYFSYTNSAQDFYCIRIRPSSDYFLTANTNGVVFEGLVNSTSTYSTISGSTGGLYSCAYARDSTYFAVAGVDSHVFVFNATSRANSIQAVLDTGSGSTFKSLQFSYDSNNLLAGNQNGTVYFFKRFCNGCPVGSYPNKTICKKCVEALVGCSICINSTVCKSCMSGYYISSGVCKSCDVLQGCATCNSSANCSTCMTGFYKSGLTCIRCLTTQYGCQQCNGPTQCLQCDKNSYLDNGTCIKCTTLTHCIYCNSSTNCLECRPGYWEDGGVCTACQSAVNPYCLICQGERNCTSCVSGYRVNSSYLCEKCLPQCLFCNNTGHCFDCVQSMYLSASYVCTFCVHPCATCNSSTYCHACVPSYYLSAAGVCTNCPADCLSCNTSARCQSCDVGYYLDTGTRTCKKCSVQVANCRECTASACLVCELEYHLDAGACSKCSALINNCQVCDSTTICQQCLTGYYATGLTGNSSCHLCDEPGCSSCKSSTDCSACEPGYYISSQDCILCGNNCLTCTSNLATACTSCIQGFYLSSTTTGSCQSCSVISKCVACLNSSYCVGCQIGTFRSSPTLCSACTRPCTTCNTSATDCLTCDLGFYFSLNGTTGTCTPCSTGCAECTTSNVTCTSCIQGYYQNSTSQQCISCSLTLPYCSSCDNPSSCLQCQPSYYPTNNTCIHCQIPIPKCLRCNVLGTTCSLCDYGFAPSATNTSCQSCQLAIANCQHCVSALICDTCKAMFYVSNGTCLGCVSGCLICYNGTVCQQCADTYVMLANKVCQLCEDAMVGCQRCTSNSVCSDCVVGYYLNASSCSACRLAMEGCQVCSDGSHCQQCSLFYQLQSNSTCAMCSSLYTGCQVCSNTSVGCTECQVGFFVFNGSCMACSNSTSQGCLKCSSNSSCSQCMSGYYLNTTTSLCIKCDTTFASCIYCNSTACLQCQSGYYLNNGTCSACPRQGCEICLHNDPNKCVGCNSRYYKMGDLCLLCSVAIPQCQECQTSLYCANCASGFYLTPAYQCGLCSDMFPGCFLCSSSGCIDCMANFFLNSTDLKCHNCTDHIIGCSFCVSESICISCQNGYYISNSTCQPCTTIHGCLYCVNYTHCTHCQQSFYLEQTNYSCYSCKDVLPGCYACDNSTMCVGCQGNYQLVGGMCEEIKGEVVKKYSSIGIKSSYVSDTQLQHTLYARQFQFSQIDQDWPNVAELALISKNYTRYPLVIIRVEWATSLKELYFFTDNPIADQLSDSVKNMPFVKHRLLQDSSVDLGFNLKFMLNEKATHDIMPKLSHLGDLYLDYPYSDPAFYESYLRNRSYSYFVFGLVVTILLLIGYSVKLCCLVPSTKDRGSIIPHIFAIKCGALAVYPAYGEYVSFCYGFMTADFPWLNSVIGPKLGNANDVSPEPYKVYYSNLSLVSTYFISLFVILIIWSLINTVGYFCQNLNKKIESLKSLLYNFFSFGVVLSGCLCLQGAILNPIDSLSMNTVFYIVGIVMYFGVFVELVYSWSVSRSIRIRVKEDVDDIGTGGHLGKLRTFTKATILSLMHLNPVYYISACFCTELGLILLQHSLTQSQKPNPKLQSLQHILTNLSLLLLVLVSDALVGIVLAILLVVLVLGCQCVRIYGEVGEVLRVGELGIDGGMMGMMGMGVDGMGGSQGDLKRKGSYETTVHNMVEQEIKNQNSTAKFLPLKSIALYGTDNPNNSTNPQSISSNSSPSILPKSPPDQSKPKKPNKQTSVFRINELRYQ